jgi:transcription termination factor Rho
LDKRPTAVRGVLEAIEGGDGLVVYESNTYRIKPKSVFISKLSIQRDGLRHGQDITACLHLQIKNSGYPFAIKIYDMMEGAQGRLRFAEVSGPVALLSHETLGLVNEGALAIVN